jgi:hypothetical protein
MSQPSDRAPFAVEILAAKRRKCRWQSVRARRLRDFRPSGPHAHRLPRPRAAPAAALTETFLGGTIGDSLPSGDVVSTAAGTITCCSRRTYTLRNSSASPTGSHTRLICYGGSHAATFISRLPTPSPCIPHIPTIPISPFLHISVPTERGVSFSAPQSQPQRAGAPVPRAQRRSRSHARRRRCHRPSSPRRRRGRSPRRR